MESLDEKYNFNLVLIQILDIAIFDAWIDELCHKVDKVITSLWSIHIILELLVNRETIFVVFLSKSPYWKNECLVFCLIQNKNLKNYVNYAWKSLWQNSDWKNKRKEENIGKYCALLYRVVHVQIRLLLFSELTCINKEEMFESKTEDWLHVCWF